MKRLILAVSIISALALVGQVFAADTVTMSASPSSLVGGGKVTLSWRSSTYSCRANGANFYLASNGSLKTPNPVIAGWETGKLLSPQDSTTVNLPADPGRYLLFINCGVGVYASAEVRVSSDPTKANVTYSQVSGGNWVKGNSLSVLWNKEAFGSSLVDIWICTGTNPNSNCSIPGGYSAIALGISNTGSRALTFSGPVGTYYFYVRKNGDWSNTYSGNGWSGAITVVDPPTTPPVVTPPVDPPNPPANVLPVVTLNAMPTSASLGQNVALSWSTRNPSAGMYCWNNVGLPGVDKWKNALPTSSTNLSGQVSVTIVPLPASGGNANAGENFRRFYISCTDDAHKNNTSTSTIGLSTSKVVASSNIVVNVSNQTTNAPVVKDAFLGGSLYYPATSIYNNASAYINWSFANFNKKMAVSSGGFTKTVNAVSFKMCDPVSGVCDVFPVGTKSNDGRAYFYLLTSQTAGNIRLNPYLYGLQSSVGLTKILVICPLAVEYVNNVQYYYNISGGVCSYSVPFKILDVNNGNSPTWNVSTGQGCLENECVCVNGQAKRCGQPLKAGTGCPATAWCSAGPVSYSGSRLVGLISFWQKDFISLFFNPRQ